MGSSLGEVIKKMAVGANNANAPTALLFGIVTSINPLVIDVEQKLQLTKEFLVLTKNVKDYTVDVTIDWNTESEELNANHNHEITGNIQVDSVSSDPITNTVTNTMNVMQKDIDLTHNHKIKGRKQITIHNALKVGDEVILIQQQGGNNFIVLDKF